MRYNAYIQFEQYPDLEFNIESQSVETAEQEVKKVYPNAKDIWIVEDIPAEQKDLER